MDQSEPLHTAGDVPVPEFLSPGQQKLSSCPGFLLGDGGTSSRCPVFVPFFVTVFKTLNNCPPDVQVAIKLCKENGHALGEALISLGHLEETGALTRSVWCSAIQSFSFLAHVENGTVFGILG